MVPKSAKEKEQRKVAFKKMNFPQKIEYIFAYYKLPIFTVLIAATVLISTIVSNMLKKDPILYMAFENVTIGESLKNELTNDYLLETDRDISQNEIILYEDLYIAEDPSPENQQFAYASKIKVLGSIAANKMDLVLMNQEAYDQMSQSGLLLDLEETISKDDELIKTLGSLLKENLVILEDNAIAYDLGKDETYEATSDYFYNAIEVSKLPLFARAGFDKEVYLGIIGNTKRLEECLNWLRFISKK